MTQEEKARAYDEALEKAKKIKSKILSSHLSTESCKAVSEYIDEIIPELRESEDERIRKEIIDFIDFIQWSEDRGMTRHDYHQAKRPAVWIAYLEKQKECVVDNNKTSAEEDERIRKGLFKLMTVASEAYLVESTGIKKDSYLAYLERQKEPYYTKRNALFDKCVENCDPKTVEEVNKRVDDIMNMPELSAFEQALTNLIGYWEDDEEKWPSKFVKKHGKHILDMAREELQKEQKPVEYLSKDKVYAIMNKLTELSTSNLIPFNSPEYLKIHQITKDVRSLLDYPIEQKPNIEICPHSIKSKSYKEKTSEWSEEDEEMLNSCISSIEEAKENRYAYKETDGDTSYDHEIDWLKSLRPSWKPSEEQMEALEYVIRDYREDSCNATANYLQEILDHLKNM